MNEADHPRLLTRQAEQANDFLLNARKWDRERWVRQRFPEALNVPYRREGLTAPGEQPSDVLFEGVGFEVFFVLDEGRRLNEEWCEEPTRCRQVASLRQLIRREERPQRIVAAELQARLAPTLCKKAHSYSERSADHDELDLLAFVNLKRAVPDFNTPFPSPIEHLCQDWYSLLMVGLTSAQVLSAHFGAPEFLCASLGCNILFDVEVGL